MDQEVEYINLLQRLLPGGIVIHLTDTMLKKSTIDASKKIREFLSKYSIFDFDELAKGTKEIINCQLFYEGSLFEREMSLLRPNAKPDRPGDPRLWIYNLNKNVKGGDSIYLAFKNDILFVIPIGRSSKFVSQIENVFGEQLNYVVSSGLKDLIGKQLITDEFVAIFELVKNSFDAHATAVNVIFKDLTTNNAKIIIQDDGKGMSFDELQNKWLFVGYSAKKDGTEDDDYRYGLGVKRVYAGAKGVGRFSCDRLGSQLKLITRKDEPNSSTEVLYTDWKKFEENAKARFEDIGVRHETVSVNEIPLEHGTILEISNLSDTWDRKKLLKLRLSLEKLILPSESKKNKKTLDRKRKEFEIRIEAKDEIIEDMAEWGFDPTHPDKTELENYYEIVNGPIRNLVYETLKLKTTSIDVVISDDGEEITTCLSDRGEEIYQITERNKYDLKGIHIKLYHLNQSAKNIFSRRMGFPIMRYGHVFVFKNGFRIYPFGEFQEDGFGIEIRKSDKEFSKIGTRSLSGRIEIYGDPENKFFIESTSRDAGFIQNNSFEALKSCYHDILTRFEKYVVDVIKWGTHLEFKDLAEGKQKEEMLNLISEITGSDAIIKLWYNEKIVDILASKQETSAKKLLTNLQNAVEKTGETELVQDIRLAQQRLLELEEITEQAEQIADDAKISIQEARKALEFEQQKNKYLLAADKNISDDTRGILHNIKLVNQKIYNNIEILADKVKAGSLKEDELLERLGNIKFSADKAYKMSRLMTKADFRNKQEKATIDIASYIEEYINEYNSLFEERRLKFEFHRRGQNLFRRLSMLDISIVIDNLISNSEKKGANKARIDFSTFQDNQIELIFSDNGDGLSKDFLKAPEVIFELGITDTDGSGIGLNSVQNILKDNNASIEFWGNGKVLKGASFKITFN